MLRAFHGNSWRIAEVPWTSESVLEMGTLTVRAPGKAYWWRERTLNPLCREDPLSAAVTHPANCSPAQDNTPGTSLSSQHQKKKRGELALSLSFFIPSLLTSLCLFKSHISHKKPNTVWFHLNEVSKVVKFIEMEIEWWVPGAGC